MSRRPRLCAALDDGADPADLGQEILDGRDLTTRSGRDFVVTSVDSYCPEYSGYFE